jgi:hypothetical protein
MSPPRKHVVPELWVMFDTSAIYSGSAHYLVKKEISDAIQDNGGHTDLKIRWIVPAIVKAERQYQMTRLARTFLPTVQKLERLLGHNLNIADDILELRVREAVQRSIDSLGLEVEDIAVDKVDWPVLIARAVNRRPPFEAGDTEKGFRDSILLETFAQLVERAPRNAAKCRLAFVANDQLLISAVRERTLSAPNVRLCSLEDLRGLINTLVSEVDEEFVKGIMPQADRLFFNGRDQPGLYNDAKLRARVEERIKKDVGDMPDGADTLEIAKYLINKPQFVRKDRQQIHWSTRLEVKVEAKGDISSPNRPLWSSSVPLSQYGNLAAGNIVITGPTGPIGPSGPISPTLFYTSQPSPSGAVYSSDLFAPIPAKVVLAYGKCAYDVAWSTSITTARKLKKAQLDSISFVDVSWAAAI